VSNAEMEFSFGGLRAFNPAEIRSGLSPEYTSTNYETFSVNGQTWQNLNVQV